MAVLVVAVVGGLLFLAAPAASAQTGYPPGPCTATTGTQNVGTVQVGQRFVVQVAPICLFTPGAAVTVTVNGVDIPGKTAEAGGFVLVDITVLSATELSVNPIVPAICGTNTVTARGPSTTAQGGTSTQSATFELTCPAAGVPGAGVATPVTGRLTLTGANSLRVAVAALALVAAGAMLVVVTRRRRAV